MTRLYADLKPRLAVAPMMDWTDRHCRYFHRLLAPSALLYTEMVVADAAIHGERERLLGFSPDEHPVALQLGGSEPAKLAEAARIGEGFGYDEINLNVGCPSDRVQSGTFGACLMKAPALVADCVAAMKVAVAIPVTVKCRIGVDEQDPEAALSALAGAVFDAGADALWVHARKAWLEGLSPKENREIPPLDHGRVHRLQAEFPNRFIGVNGGIATVNQVLDALNHVDGVMLGRAAYHEPAVLFAIEKALAGNPPGEPDFDAIVAAMTRHAAAHVAGGGRVGHVTRHMLGLFHGRPGARRWRQMLTEGAARNDADAGVIARAYAAVRPALATAAA
ncbi:MAG: tRNA dihydrouridine(20/20a) synthase DusA [Phyllobacteriaceae bacterium]|nr:tRNA dihydrouridine(20/20a) synthase DusA [Phyllobacteriaceae bacterium]